MCFLKKFELTEDPTTGGREALIPREREFPLHGEDRTCVWVESEKSITSSKELYPCPTSC